VTELGRVEVLPPASDGLGVCLVRLFGEIDLSNVRELSAAIAEGIPNDGSPVVFDLSETRYLDSTGIQLLFRLADTLRSRRRDLTLIVPEDAPIRTVIAITGLGVRAPVLASLEDLPRSGPSRVTRPDF